MASFIRTLEEALRVFIAGTILVATAVGAVAQTVLIPAAPAVVASPGVLEQILAELKAIRAEQAARRITPIFVPYACDSGPESCKISANTTCINIGYKAAVSPSPIAAPNFDKGFWCRD
ncbi:hypothetical protein [Terrarubrum flagellatum]|uniref:hypothetical protein n=1 Tax=Terrirubrum flagellatum TaxID=2895980 RepID=UPI003144DB86